MRFYLFIYFSCRLIHTPSSSLPTLTAMLLCMLFSIMLLLPPECFTQWKWSFNCPPFCFYFVLSFKPQQDGYWQIEILDVTAHLEVMIYVITWSFPLPPSSIQQRRSSSGFKSDWARIINSFGLWGRRVQCYLLSWIRSGGLSTSVLLREGACGRWREDIVLIQGHL